MRILYIWFYSRSFPDYPKIAEVLREQGHHAWVAGYNDSGDIVWREGEDVVATLPGPAAAPDWIKKIPGLRSLWNILAYWPMMLRLRRFFIEQQADIVHVCPNNARLVWTLPLMMPNRMRFITDYRQIAQREGQGFIGQLRSAWSNRLRTIYCRRLFDRATFLHEEGAKKVLGSEWQRWSDVVPLGVDERFLTYQRNGRMPQATDDEVTFLYLGSIARVRKLENLLEAAQRVATETDGFRLDFIGPDTSDGYYHNLVDKMALQSVVEIKAPVPYDTVPTTVAGYDVTLTIVPESPPDWKYQPTIKGIEYRALGMPVIATDFVPNRELVQDGINGALVENTAESISEAMLLFVRDPQFLLECRRNAQAMRLGPTWNKIAAMYLHQVYEPLLDS